MCQLCDCLDVVFFREVCIELFEQLAVLKKSYNINILLFNYEKKYISLNSVDNCNMQNYFANFNSLNTNYIATPSPEIYFNHKDILLLNLLNKCDFCIADYILPSKIVNEVLSNVKIISV